MEDEKAKLKAMEKRIKELEKLSLEKQILLEFNSKMLELASEKYDIDLAKLSGKAKLDVEKRNN